MNSFAMCFSAPPVPIREYAIEGSLEGKTGQIFIVIEVADVCNL